MKKGRIFTIIFVLIFFVGLSLLLYPTVSNYWNSLTQSKAVADYHDAVSEMDEENYRGVLEEAAGYNRALAETAQKLYLDEEEKEVYEKLLDVSGSGIMGSVEIPSIDCDLPIYHGTDESVLQIAIGHIEWTSLPVGGEGTHCVISGHRGLPSARLFTELDQLMVGDIFMLRILDETLTYEVDQILIVEPREIEELKITKGEDYCTLMTCTPYGINTHRLLVRGRRIENIPDYSQVRVVSDAVVIRPMLVAVLIAIPILIFMLAVFLKPRRKSRIFEGDMDEDD